MFLPSSLFNGVPRLLLLLSGRAGGVLAELGRLCVRGGLHRLQHVRDQRVLVRRAHRQPSGRLLELGTAKDLCNEVFACSFGCGSISRDLLLLLVSGRLLRLQILVLLVKLTEAARLLRARSICCCCPWSLVPRGKDCMVWLPSWDFWPAGSCLNELPCSLISYL